MKTLFGSAAALGTLLVVLSHLWPAVADKNEVWSAEQHQEFTAALSDAHRLSQSQSAKPNQKTAEQFRQAKSRAERAQAELQGARQGDRTTNAILWWSGLLLASVGAAGHFMHRAASG